MLDKEIIKRTLRVPLPDGHEGDAFATALRLDSALLKSGFKLSLQLFEAVAKLDDAAAESLAATVIASVSELLGAHVRHNVYFERFPQSVPDTMEFWTGCIADALGNEKSAGIISAQLPCGFVNLLDLPKYGQYLHSYEDMCAVHKAFTGQAKSVKVLQLGGSYAEESRKLYESLAGSVVPLSEGDRDLLVKLAEAHVDDEAPESVPMRENRAIINSVRLDYDRPIFVDTVTDVLRLAAHLSGGDVTLATPTKFKSMSRPYRRRILETLHRLAKESPEKLSDVLAHQEPWKRLAERLHPWEYLAYPGAQTLFEVADGRRRASTFGSKVERLLSDGDVAGAVDLLKTAPGRLYRSINRLLTLPGQDNEELVFQAVSETAPSVPARILFGLKEYLRNRQSPGVTPRIFTNTKGKSWVTEDGRQPLIARGIDSLIDIELASRLPDLPLVAVDPTVLGLAVPFSDKSAESGFAVMPRGSVTPVCRNGENLRFFCYWKAREERTDYDLSVLFTDESFVTTGFASWTSLKDIGYVHSGDITSAENGASEFIDIDLSKVKATYIIPQVNIYAGEGFLEVEECFFGFMERHRKEWGLPFEPASVRFKSGMRGVGKVVLPLVFAKQSDGSWSAFWMQIYLKGRARMNRVEANRVSTSLLANSVVKRQYLRFDYVVDLLKQKARDVLFYSEGEFPAKEPILYIGLSIPEGLPEGSVGYALGNLHELVGLFEPTEEEAAADSAGQADVELDRR